MKKFIFVVLVLVVLGGLGYWLLGKPASQVMTSPTPTAAQYDQTVSDGTITIGYQTGQYGLATTPAQVLVTAYIPPCDPAFTYCLYYNGATYKGTNFDSAGLRIQKRTDLKTQGACLSTMPTGYTNIVPVTANGPDYATGVFSPLGDAGAGHYASGSEYRLWTNNTCYEFETRIGQTQFANYPPGTIKQFTTNDQANVEADLRGMINSVTLKSGAQVSFPQPPQTTQQP